MEEREKGKGLKLLWRKRIRKKDKKLSLRYCEKKEEEEENGKETDLQLLL